MKLSFILLLVLICVYNEAGAFGAAYFDEDELGDEELRQDQTRICIGGRLYRLDNGGIECCRGEGRKRKCSIVPCELEDDEMRQGRTRVCQGGRAYRRGSRDLYCCRGTGVARKCRKIDCQVDEADTPRFDALDEFLDEMDFGDEIDIGADEENRQTSPAFCNLPAYTGNCRAAFPRFYYHPESKSCRGFIYGGCNSNGNNFKTPEECLATCTPK